MPIDPILLEVLRNRLDAIADEMELTLLKSAASPIVKEGLDASAALFNTRGETIAQAAAIPIHLGALQFAAQRLVRAFPPERMRDGDAFLLNDPYDGGTHLPDITLAVPVFADGRAVALACTMCHHQDVGGRTPGSVPTDATELYQEGVIIPPTQLFRAGELDENLFRLLTRNVRLPEVFTGDLMAQVAAGRLGGVRLRELFAAHGAPTVVAYIEELLSRAERLTRAQIEAIPDGDYAFEGALPGKMPAASSGTLLVMAFGGRDPETDRPFVASELAAGGMGARPNKDGIDVIETDVSNCMNIPVESVEMNFPLRIPRLRLWRDSGGAGRFRGGLGLEKVFEATTTDVLISHRSERFASSPWGLEGGAPGARACAFVLRKDGTREALPSKKMIVLHPGDQLWEYVAGGAGYGDPLDRNSMSVLADVLDGKISATVARGAYGVVLTSEGTAIDEIATKECREAQRGDRGPLTWTFDRGTGHRHD